MSDLGFIVEGHCEYDSFPSIVCKIQGFPRKVPLINAGGIGNIIKNTGELLLQLIKFHEPRKIIISLDYRDALKENLVENCIQLKNLIVTNCDIFMNQQLNGSLNLPESIVVIIADKTYETWICADVESLKNNDFFESSKITEEFTNVDEQIENPSSWLKDKLKENVDIKSRAIRTKIYKSIDPHIAKDKSRSFAKFYKEVNIYA